MFSHQICFHKGHNFSREKYQDFLPKTVHMLFAVLDSVSLFLTPLALGNWAFSDSCCRGKVHCTDKKYKHKWKTAVIVLWHRKRRWHPRKACLEDMEITAVLRVGFGNSESLKFGLMLKWKPCAGNVGYDCHLQVWVYIWTGEKQHTTWLMRE